MSKIVDFNQVDRVMAQQKTLYEQSLEMATTSRGLATAWSPDFVRFQLGGATFGEALGAAFLQENTVASGFSNMSFNFEPVSGFNNSAKHKGMLGYYEQYVDQFPELMNAESPQELVAVQNKIKREIENRTILENIGFWEGLLYYLPAGILSPENFLPIATAVRGIGLGAKTVGKMSAARAAAVRTGAYEVNPMTGTVARTAAGAALSKKARRALLLRSGMAKNTIPQIAGLSAVEGTLSGAVAEIILNAQQGLRTKEEMVMGVIGGGVFGGILGASFAGIGKGYRASLEKVIGHEYLSDAVNDANMQYSRALVNSLEDRDVDVGEVLKELESGVNKDATLAAQKAWEDAIEVVDGKVAGPIKRLAGFKEEGWFSTIAKKIVWLNPNIQLALSKSSRAKNLGEILTSNPLIRVADDSIETQGKFNRPSIESMIHLVELDAFRKIQTVNAEFNTYKKGGGKLNQQTFNELVGRLHRRGGDFTLNDINDIKENGSRHFPGVELLDDADILLLKNALEKGSKATGEFFDNVKQLAMQTGAFTKLSDSETVGNIVQYFAREYDIDKIKLDREGFAEVLRKGREDSIDRKKKTLQVQMRAAQNDITYLNRRKKNGVLDPAERDELEALIQYKKELTEEFKNVRDVSELKIQQTIDKILGEAETISNNPNNAVVTARIKNFLERTLDISDEALEDFLISDADYIMGKMIRHTLPDLLLSQYLGSSKVSELLRKTEFQLMAINTLNKKYLEDPSDANAKELVEHMQDLRNNLNKLNMINAFRTVPETTRKDLETSLNEILDIEEGEFNKGAEQISKLFDERNEFQKLFNNASDEVRKLQLEYVQSRDRIRQLSEQMSDTSDFDSAVGKVIQAADRAELEKLHKEDMEEAVQTKLEETEEYVNAKNRAEDADSDYIEAQVESREDGKGYADAVATEFADGIEVVRPRRAGQTAKEIAESVVEEPAIPEATVSGKEIAKEPEVTAPFKKQSGMDDDLYPYYEGSIDGIPIRLIKDEDADGKPVFIIDEELLGEGFKKRKEEANHWGKALLDSQLELENTLEKSIEELKQKIKDKKFPFEETQDNLSRTDLKEAKKYVEEQGIVSMDGKPIDVNQDGTVTLYHRTTPEAAQRMRESGEFVSRENTNETFFSNKKEGQTEGYGDAIVEVRVPAQQVRIDDAFPDGEIHVAVSNDDIGRANMTTPRTPTHAEDMAPEPELRAKVEETVEPETPQATSVAEFLNNRYNRATNENIASDGEDFGTINSTARDTKAERKRAEERAEWARNKTELEYLVGAIEELLELEALPQKVSVEDIANKGTVPSIRKNGDPLVGHKEGDYSEIDYSVEISYNGSILRNYKKKGSFPGQQEGRVKRDAVTHIHGRKKGEVSKLPLNQALSIIRKNDTFYYVDELELEKIELEAVITAMGRVPLSEEVFNKLDSTMEKKINRIKELEDTAVPARNTRGANSQHYFEDYLDFLETNILEPAPEGSGKLFQVKKDYKLALEKLRFGAARSEDLSDQLEQKLKNIGKIKRQSRKEMATIEAKIRKEVEREFTLDKQVNEIMEDFVGGGVMAVNSRGTKVSEKIKHTLETYKVKEEVEPEGGKKPKKPPKPFMKTIEELLYAKNKTEMSAETRTIRSEIEILLRKLEQKKQVKKRHAQKRKGVDSKIYKVSQILGAARNSGNGHRPIQYNYNTRTRVNNVFDPQLMSSAVEGLIGATSNIRRNAFRDQVSLDPHFRVIDMEYKRSIKAATTTKEINKLEKSRDREKQLIATMVSRLRNTDGFSDEAQFAQKASRILRNYNYLRSMGGVVISSIPDIVMGVSTAGFSNYARAWAKFIQREWTEKGEHRDDMAMLLWAGETVLGRNRAASVFDTEQPFRRTAGSGTIDKLDYASGVAADRFSKWSGTNSWNGMMKSISAIAIQSRIIQVSKKRAAGKSISKSDQAFMNFIGISNDVAVDIARIHEGMADATDLFMGHTFYYSKSDKWSGNINGVSSSRVSNAKITMEAAVHTGVNNTVLTPNAGVIPPELTTWWGRLLNQFRSFMLQSTETILVSGTQRAVAARDMNQVTTVLGLTFMGTMVYALKEALMGRDAVSGVLEGDEEEIRKLLFNGLDRGGALALPMEANNIIHSLAGGGGPINKLFGVSEEAGRFRERDFISTISAPLGTVEDVVKAGTALFSRGIDSEEELFKSDRTRARRSLPFQNLWWLSVGLDVVPNLFGGGGTYFNPNYRIEEQLYGLIGGEPEAQR